VLSRRKHGRTRLWTSVALLLLLVLAIAEPQLLNILNPFSNLTNGTWILNFTAKGQADINFSLSGQLYCADNESQFSNYTCPGTGHFLTEVGYGNHTLDVTFGNESATAQAYYPEPAPIPNGTTNSTNQTVNITECESPCDDDNTCTDDSCINGSCVYTNNSNSCDDELFCTVNDTCSDGVCSGLPLSCDDGNSSTNDSCNEGADECAHLPAETNRTRPEDGTPANAVGLTQYGAVLGRPVKWEKRLKIIADTDSLAVSLPDIARNVSARRIDGSGTATELNASVETKAETMAVAGEPMRIDIGVDSAYAVEETAGNVTVEVSGGLRENDTLVVEYYTEAPRASEISLSNNKKRVTVSGPDYVHYTNVRAFSDLPINVSDKAEILLYKNSSEADFDAIDSDGDGFYDRIEWTVPHLSNQTYDIIVITKAMHLDENRSIIEDIYDKVKGRDDVWSGPIPEGHYVRATFRSPLDRTRDITVYARSNSTARIEVYHENDSILVAVIDGIGSEGEYRTYLTDMIGAYDTFDLRIVGDSVDFDHIIDPILILTINSAQNTTVADASQLFNITTSQNANCTLHLNGTSYVDGQNVLTNLSATDTGDWMGTSAVYSAAYDSTHDLVYLGIDAGKFGVYNRTSGVTTNLSGTDTGNWIGTNYVYSVAYDSTHDLVYLGINKGKFGVYNRTSNVTTDLSATDTNPTANWIGTYSSVRSVAYDSTHDLVYLGIGEGKFGVYNRTSNVTTDLSATDTSNWMLEEGVNSVAYDSTHDLVYLGLNTGKFGVYNRTSNVTTDLSAKDTGDWIAASYIRYIAYDSTHDLVYLGIDAGKFGVYNRTSGVTTSLSATDTNNWIGTSNVRPVAYDSTHNLVYLGLAAGKFGVYNRTSNVATNLSATDTGNWIGTSVVNSIAYDSTHNLVYLGINDGKFGVYTPQETGHTWTETLSEGNYTHINFTCQNLTGSSVTSGTYWLKVDTIAPTITITSVQNTTITTSHTFNVTLSESGNCSLYLNGTWYPNSTVGTNPRWAKTLTEANYTGIYYRCKDVYNNSGDSGTYWLKVDATAPTITITSVQNTTITATSHTFNVTINEAGNCSVYYESAWHTMSGATTIKTLTNSSMTQGNHSGIYYRCQDTAGNKRNSSTYWLNVDSIAPTITINSAKNTTITTTSHTFNVTLNETGNCSLYLDGIWYANSTPGTNLRWAKTLIETNHTGIYYRCRDVYSNYRISGTYWLAVDFCGDGTCSGETCKTCPEDCGRCSGTGGDGGGAIGGYSWPSGTNVPPPIGSGPESQQLTMVFGSGILTVGDTIVISITYPDGSPATGIITVTSPSGYAYSIPLVDGIATTVLSQSGVWSFSHTDPNGKTTMRTVNVTEPAKEIQPGGQPPKIPGEKVNPDPTIWMIAAAAIIAILATFFIFMRSKKSSK